MLLAHLPSFVHAYTCTLELQSDDIPSMDDWVQPLYAKDSRRKTFGEPQMRLLLVLLVVCVVIMPYHWALDNAFVSLLFFVMFLLLLLMFD